MVPRVLVIEFEAARFTPTLAWEPNAAPVTEMAPLPAVVETAPTLLILTP